MNDLPPNTDNYVSDVYQKCSRDLPSQQLDRQILAQAEQQITHLQPKKPIWVLRRVLKWQWLSTIAASVLLIGLTVYQFPMVYQPIDSLDQVIAERGLAQSGTDSGDAEQAKLEHSAAPLAFTSSRSLSSEPIRAREEASKRAHAALENGLNTALLDYLLDQLHYPQSLSKSKNPRAKPVNATAIRDKIFAEIMRFKAHYPHEDIPKEYWSVLSQAQRNAILEIAPVQEEEK